MKQLNFILLAIPCVLFSAACSRSSYTADRRVDYSQVDDPMAVKVYLGNPSIGMDVKSAGAVDGVESFTGKNIKVYAFSSEEGVDWTKEKAPSGAPVCLVNGLEARVEGSDHRAWWLCEPSRTPAYPNMELCLAPYDFYACYLDDCAYTETRTSDAVYLNLSINGRQDLMSSTAPQPEEGSFCYVNARRNVHPVFVMQHALVKMRFRVKGGLLPGVDPEDITVSGLTVTGPSLGRFYVAGKEQGFVFSDNSDNKVFPYQNADGTSAGEVTVQTISDENDEIDDAKATFIGEDACLLMAPASEYIYNIDLTIKDKNGELRKNNHKSNLRLASGAFQAGKLYTFTMTVFGHNNVAVTIDEQDWITASKPLEGTDDV